MIYRKNFNRHLKINEIFTLTNQKEFVGFLSDPMPPVTKILATPAAGVCKRML